VSVRPPQDTVLHALRMCLRHPHRNLVLAWSWKAATVSAFVRALVFLFSNRHDGRHDAVKAMLVEAGYSIVASGLMGALTQRMRATRPLWLTALLVWIAMPVAMVAGEAGAHHLFRTPHVRSGLVSSFLLAAVASGYTWFAMRRGTLLQGVGDDSLRHDVKLLPRITLDFALWPFQKVRQWIRPR
jgi:hypothetical protein